MKRIFIFIIWNVTPFPTVATIQNFPKPDSPVTEIKESVKLYKISKYDKKYKNKVYLINKVIKTIRITLNFNEEQINKIKMWFKICDSVYDECLRLYSTKNKNFTYISKCKYYIKTIIIL